jgi:hypothetical protein
MGNTTRFKQGDENKLVFKNLFSVAKTVPEKDRMKAGTKVIITILDVVDPLKKIVHVRIDEAFEVGSVSFEEGEELNSFVPTTIINAIEKGSLPMGEPTYVEYLGLDMSKEKNEKTGTKVQFHNFKFYKAELNA